MATCKLSDVLSSKDKWIKGQYGKDSLGNAVDVCRIDQACQVCMLGAVNKCRMSEGEMDQKFTAIIKRLFPGRLSPDTRYGTVDFNDSILTTFEEVQAVIREYES